MMSEFLQYTWPMESRNVAVTEGGSDSPPIHQVFSGADTQLESAREFGVIEKDVLVRSGLLEPRAKVSTEVDLHASPGQKLKGDRGAARTSLKESRL